MNSARLCLTLIPPSLALVACGGDESSAPQAADAGEARQEAAATRQALAEALGNAPAAELEQSVAAITADLEKAEALLR
jgi:hypothetical protein